MENTSPGLFGEQPYSCGSRLYRDRMLFVFVSLHPAMWRMNHAGIFICKQPRGEESLFSTGIIGNSIQQHVSLNYRCIAYVLYNPDISDIPSIHKKTQTLQANNWAESRRLSWKTRPWGLGCPLVAGCGKCFVSPETFCKVENGHSDHFQWVGHDGTFPAPFHKQPMSCFVTAEPGRLWPNHVVPPAHEHM